jgi:hypothetical protein
MNTASLMLAMALPATQAAAKQAASAVNTIGGVFASMLQMGESALSTTAESGADDAQTLSASLTSLAEKMRDWLRQNGIQKPYAIHFRLESSGESQLDFAGEAANQVQQLLASDSAWQGSLRKLAATAQTESLRGGYPLVSPVTIEIDDQKSKLY